MGQLLSGHTCSMLALDKQSAYDIDSEECVSYRMYCVTLLQSIKALIHVFYKTFLMPF